MNGRVYSPSIGRMLSPDPVTQAPENVQNYNRFSYVLNNPLKYTDPSGYQLRQMQCQDNCMGETGVTARDLSGTGGSITNTYSGFDLGGSGSSVGLGGSPIGAVGDSATAYGDAKSGPVPVSEVEEDLEPGECRGNTCRAELLPDKLFWRSISDWTAIAGMISSGTTIVCTPCGVVSGPVALILTGVSIGAGVAASDSDTETVKSGLAAAIEPGLNAVLDFHPLTNKIPKNIRTKVAGVVGIAITGAGVTAGFKSHEEAVEW